MADEQYGKPFNMEDWFAKYQEEVRKKEEIANRRTVLVCRLLRLLKVESAVMAFDGEGDSGTVEAPHYQPEPPAGIPTAFGDCLVASGYTILPGGWEINEGSHGTIHVDVASAKMESHVNYREEYAENDEDDEEETDEEEMDDRPDPRDYNDDYPDALDYMGNYGDREPDYHRDPDYHSEDDTYRE